MLSRGQKGNKAPKRNFLIFILFIAILLLGLFLRIYHLDEESLWVDEAYTLQHAQAESLTEMLQGIIQTEGAPPGHYLLLYYGIKIFADSEFSLRFPSMIFGLLSIVLLYKLGTLLFNRNIALMASLFLSTSMLQILYSQEARIYSLFGFLALLTAYLFFLIIEKEKIGQERGVKDGKLNLFYLVYFLVMLLSFTVNYMTGSLVVLYTIILFWFRGQFSLKKLIVTNFLVLGAALPLFWFFLRQQAAAADTGYQTTLIQKGMPFFLAKFGTIIYLLPIIFVICLALIAVIYRQKLPRFFLEERFFLFSIISFSAVYLYLVLNPFSFFGIPVFNNPITHSYFLVRHSYFLIPILYLFLAQKIFSMKRFASFCLLVILMVNAFSLFTYYESSTKAEWQEATTFIKKHSLGKPVILLDRAGSSSKVILNYYLDPEIVPLTWGLQMRPQVIDLETLPLLLAEKEQFWLLLARNPATQEKYVKILDQNCHQNLFQKFYRIKVYQYDSCDF